MSCYMHATHLKPAAELLRTSIMTMCTSTRSLKSKPSPFAENLSAKTKTGCETRPVGGGRGRRLWVMIPEKMASGHFTGLQEIEPNRARPHLQRRIDLALNAGTNNPINLLPEIGNGALPPFPTFLHRG